MVTSAQPRWRIWPGRACEPQGKRSAEQMVPELIGWEGALIVTIKSVHVAAAAHEADRRLRRQHLKNGKHDFARQRKRNGEA